ncbi:MAG: hypothetical protein EBT00_14960 [Proteobacteria bacterium]|nr:hypothetical protein [Pseudomonadota bacterium]
MKERCVSEVLRVRPLLRALLASSTHAKLARRRRNFPVVAPCAWCSVAVAVSSPTPALAPWLATGYSYAEDFSALTVNIRKGAEWGDGQAFTANDVAFTFNLLKDNQKLTYGGDMKKYIKSVEATDDQTVVFTFNSPNPRFLFEYLAFKFDNGVKLLPKHIFEGKDPLEFMWFDLEKGWPCGTGPYKITNELFLPLIPTTTGPPSFSPRTKSMRRLTSDLARSRRCSRRTRP